MRLAQIHVNNYKTIKNLEIDFVKLNSYVIPILGRNNVGKSNIIEAIYRYAQVVNQRFVNSSALAMGVCLLAGKTSSCRNSCDIDSSDVTYNFLLDKTFVIKDFTGKNNDLTFQSIKICAHCTVDYTFNVKEVDALNLLFHNLQCAFLENKIEVNDEQVLKLKGAISAALLVSELTPLTFSDVELQIKHYRQQQLTLEGLKSAIITLVHDWNLTKSNLSLKCFTELLDGFIVVMRNWVDCQLSCCYQLLNFKLFYLDDMVGNYANMIAVNRNNYEVSAYLRLLAQLLKQNESNLKIYLLDFFKSGVKSLDEVNRYLAAHFRLSCLKNMFDEADLDDDNEFCLYARWDEDDGRNLLVDLGTVNKKNDSVDSLSSRNIGYIKQVFISLLLAWANQCYNGKDCLLILLDDPDTGLHVDSQHWLIKRFNALVSSHKNIKIIYTTHSPFMFDYRGFCHALGVYKQNHISHVYSLLAMLNVQKQDDLKSYWMGSTMSLLNLIGARSFWFNLNATQSNILLVEGAYDYLYLKYFSERLGLSSDKLIIMWAGGAPKVMMIANFLEGFNFKFKVLCDNDFGGNTGSRDLDKLLYDHNVTKIYKAMNKSDVESLFEETIAEDGTLDKKEQLKIIVRGDVYHHQYRWSSATLANFTNMIKAIVSEFANDAAALKKGD